MPPPNPERWFATASLQRPARLGNAPCEIYAETVQSVVFCDESPFPVSKRDTRVRIYRRVNERLAPNCIRFRGDKRSAHVWGAISWWGKSELYFIDGNLNADRYIHEVLAPVLLPFYRRHPRHAHFLQDNAPPHRAFATRDWLTAHNID